jgi:1,4-alpha-glucan branching enzyme
VIERTPDETGLMCITFRLPHANGSARAAVVGDFNGWEPTADQMERDGDGFVAHLHLHGGRAYRFRYLLDGTRWENDWNADAYVPNDHGGDDSVIDLRTSTVRAPGALPSAGARGEPADHA